MDTEVEDVVRQWLDDAPRSGEFEFYRKKASSAAALLMTDDNVYLALEPGNSTRYDLLLTRLAEPASTQVGGDLLVSLMNFNQCFVIDSTGVHYPWYLQGKVRLGDSDVTVLACLLTLVGAYLASEPT